MSKIKTDIQKSIKVSFVGTPEVGIDYFPKNGKPRHNPGPQKEYNQECYYVVANNKSMIYYSERGIRASNKSGNSIPNRFFDIRVEWDDYMIDEHGRSSILKTLNDFVDNALIDKAEIFELKDETLEYRIFSFNEKKEKLSKLIKKFESYFVSYFSGFFINIPDGGDMKYELSPTITNNSRPINSFNSKEYEDNPLLDKKIQEPRSRFGRFLVHFFETYTLGLFLTQTVIVFIIPFVLLYYFPCELSKYIEHIDKLLFSLFFAFLLIAIPHKYRIANRAEKRTSTQNSERVGDDNRFIAMTASIALIALLLTTFSRALVENGNDLGDLIKNSLCYNKSNFIIPLEKENQTHILCLDKSRSNSLRRIDNSPLGQSSKEYLKGYCNKLEINLEDNIPIWKRVKKANDITYFDLSIISFLRELANVKPNDEIIIIEFGNNASIEFKGDIKTLKKEYASKLIRLEADQQETDFISLLNVIKSLNEFENYNIHKRNKFNLLIFSDFFHDTYNGDEKNIINIIKKDSLNLVRQINYVSEKNVELNLSLINDINIERLSYPYINVKNIFFNELRNKNKWYNENEIKEFNKISFSKILSDSRLPFYYINPYSDNITSEISFEKNNINKSNFNKKSGNLDDMITFLLSAEDTIPKWGQLSYKVPSKNNKWNLLYPGARVPFSKSETLLINYKGSIYDYPLPLTFRIADIQNQILYEGKAVFIARIPKLVIIVLVLLIVVLFYYMIGYLCLNVYPQFKKS